LLAGLADRFGRANLVVYGLLVVGLITLFWVPNVTNALQFGLSFGVVSFVEGIILVATPALIRDRIEPDAAGSKDHDRVAGAYICGIQHGARARDHTAAEQGRLGERHLLGQGCELIFVNEHPLSEAAESHALEQSPAVAAQAWRIGWVAQGRFRMLALEGAAGQTSGAGSASLGERADHVITGAELRDVRSDLGDDPRHFVAQHRRHRDDIVRGEKQVGMTQPRRFHVDKDLAPDRRGDLNIL
jgi:hypothetical protein